MLEVKYCQAWKVGGDQRSYLGRSWAQPTWEGMGMGMILWWWWGSGRLLEKGTGLCLPHDRLHPSRRFQAAAQPQEPQEPLLDPSSLGPDSQAGRRGFRNAFPM